MDPLPLKLEDIVQVDPLSKVQRKQYDARDAMKKCYAQQKGGRVLGYEDDDVYKRKV